MARRDKRTRNQEKKQRVGLAPYLDQEIQVTGTISAYTNTVLKCISGPKTNMMLLTNIDCPLSEQDMSHMYVLFKNQTRMNHPVGTRVTFTAKVVRYTSTSRNHDYHKYALEL